MTTKYYNLKKGDIASHGGELITFQKVDGAYAHWLDANGKLRIGHSLEYELRNGVYYPYYSEEQYQKDVEDLKSIRPVIETIGLSNL